MTDAHYEALRLSALRPHTMGSSRRCLLPFRLWPKPVPPTPKVSKRFAQPSEENVQSVTHQHILTLGERLLTEYELNTERRIQQTCEDLVEKERRRLEKEYREQSEELIRSWKAKLEEEKENLQREFDRMLAKMERMRLERNRADEEALIRRMKDECNQALARQWKLAQEQMNRAVKQAEDQLRQLLDLKYQQEKEQYGKELIAKKEIEYKEREAKALEKLRQQLAEEHQREIEQIDHRHEQELDEWKSKLKLTEERFRREFNLRARLESDFRLLQIDYKRFMDNSNLFHSDYLLKLHHIGEQIGDEKFEQILDRILAETNIAVPSNSKSMLSSSSAASTEHNKRRDVTKQLKF